MNDKKVKTRMQEQMGEEANEEIMRRTALKRNAEPEEIYSQNRLHDPASPFLIGNYRDGDSIHDVPQESWIDMQESLFEV